MGPKAEQRKKGAAMQEARKEASPDWLAEGGIHSASNPNPGRANTEFHQRRLMLALVAHKKESKIPGPPDMTEREKSPVNGEGHQLAGPYGNPPRPAGGGILNGTSSEVAEMETSLASTLVGVAAGEPVRALSDVPATSLQHEVVLPKLVRSWSGAYCRPFVRDTNTFSLRAVPHLS